MPSVDAVWPDLEMTLTAGIADVRVEPEAIATVRAEAIRVPRNDLACRADTPQNA